MLLILRLATQLDHLAAAVGSAALAHAVRAHQLAALAANHQRRRIQALVLAAIAAAMARDFCLWYGTHDMVLNPFFVGGVQGRASPALAPHHWGGVAGLSAPPHLPLNIAVLEH